MGNGHSWFQLDLETPEPPFEYKYDPQLGFPNGRKQRIVKTTKEEMESAQLPPKLRDFCVDYWMKFLSCRVEKFPLVYRCAHQLHDFHNCEFQDHELRMKEYERERRIGQKRGENN